MFNRTLNNIRAKVNNSGEKVKPSESIA